MRTAPILNGLENRIAYAVASSATVSSTTTSGVTVFSSMLYKVDY